MYTYLLYIQLVWPVQHLWIFSGKIEGFSEALAVGFLP